MPRGNGNTKEMFIIEALKLFAEKGYDAVKVSDIAQAVGVSTPALYKHFENKKALFDALVERSRVGFEEQMSRFRQDFRTDPDKSREFIRLPLDEQIRVLQQMFIYTVFDDSPAALFRKFMTLEQFKHPEFAVILNRRYADNPFDAFESLIKRFVECGVYRGGDTHAMALEYAAPFILYISVCDREPSRRDEALAAIDRHIRQFSSVYSIARPDPEG